jgi:hypothetical protein
MARFISQKSHMTYGPAKPEFRMSFGPLVIDIFSKKPFTEKLLIKIIKMIILEIIQISPK